MNITTRINTLIDMIHVFGNQYNAGCSRCHREEEIHEWFPHLFACAVVVWVCWSGFILVDYHFGLVCWLPTPLAVHHTIHQVACLPDKSHHEFLLSRFAIRQSYSSRITLIFSVVSLTISDRSRYFSGRCAFAKKIANVSEYDLYVSVISP